MNSTPKQFQTRLTGRLVLRTTLCLALLCGHALAAPDETPARPGEWGFRPQADETLRVTPPGFAWRPQPGAAQYALEVARDREFQNVVYQAGGIGFNVHCPPRMLAPGRWFWRFRFHNGTDWSAWSSARAFAIAPEAVALPLPAREALLARIPKAHPRLFVRPEWLADLRARAQGDLQPHYERLVQECEQLVAHPPPTAEPRKYPPGTVRGSDPWRAIWWGNRTYTQRALDGAATLAFTWRLDGNEQYGQLARKLLLACAEWDPKGATGYRYNDEAGMPYNYYFARTYTFLHDLLSEDERAQCREVMRVRGKEMYDHLHPRHLWRPYSSHSNRAWHFLGEVGIAFLDEIPEAGDWVWFAANVFMNAYPVWSDADGGWHEGNAYWKSYLARFTWWADVMRAAMDINAFDKPFFSQAGYYPMYLMPPGARGGGFGDLTARRTSKDNVSLAAVFAAQARNPHWQWYVEAHGGAPPAGGYVGFVRGALPGIPPRPPTDLPSSRLFAGTGQAMLNSDLTDAKNNVQVIFKSSPFGTQSHGYEAQNAFLIYAFGERLFIRTGRRDSYGSDHHRNWMWETKSVNSVTVNGRGQGKRTAEAVGQITEFATTGRFDYVVGEAAPAYPKGVLNRFTRRILFAKPAVIVVHDILEAPEASSFAWHLHAPVEMAVNGPADIRVTTGDAACQASFLWPRELEISQTDQFDVPPRPRVKLVEYHLTAAPDRPARRQEFVTVFRPHRAGQALTGAATLEAVDGGFDVRVPTPEGLVRVRLGTEVRATLYDPKNQPLATFHAGE